jgi:hypothetical protein
VIEGVEGLDPKLQDIRLGEMDVPKKCEVRIVEPRAMEEAARRVSVDSELLLGEGPDVEV